MDFRNIFGIQGKVALITGSTKGIGRATAEVLAQAGAHVLISSRKPEDCEAVAREMRGRGMSVEALPCHIGHPEAIEATEEHLRHAYGGLDILVNNAVLSPLRSIEDTDLKLFCKTVEVDLQGYWFMSAAAARLMGPRGGGSIVNIASVAALHPDRGLALYSTLKTALIGMSRSFAVEYGNSNIRVNSILPGVIETKLADKYDEATRQKMFETMCLARLGKPEEIGHSVLYLVSPAASYVTGSSLVIDGGLSVALM